MNVVDPTKVNANEMIIYSFTDQAFTCGAVEDQVFLTDQIEKARIYALNRIARYASRSIKGAVGMTRAETAGVLITAQVDHFLGGLARILIKKEEAQSSAQFIEEINELVISLGFRPMLGDKVQQISQVLDGCRALVFALSSLGQLWPGVRLRQGGSYDLDTSELTTEYAFHNQKVNPIVSEHEEK